MSTWGEYTGKVAGFIFETKADDESGKCPPAIQSIKLNIKNRQNAIEDAEIGRAHV